jgi:glucose-6-phosphate isomerase
LVKTFQVILTEEIINQTEKQAVLHTALRAKESAVINVNGQNVVQIYDVKKDKAFFE